jgi:hypothetical protein
LILPTINKTSTNKQKLDYLSVWQSINAPQSKILQFSSHRAICIGASCSIRNSHDDFISYTPSESAVLHGISSGFTISGIGTLKRTILDDTGDEITLYLHNSLHVPDTPMCLLSPQHMAQQTTSTADGFICQSKYGFLTFCGFHSTIPYNASNNRPIIFMAQDLSPSCHPSSLLDTSTFALLSSLDLVPDETSTLSTNQCKL